MMDNPAWYKSLGFKLSMSFLLGVSFVFVLLISAERTLNETLKDTQTLLDNELGPLALVNRLQSELLRIREQEVELRRTEDHFALMSQLDHYQTLVANFDQQVQSLLVYLDQETLLRQRQLLESWSRYQQASQELAAAAEAGDSSRVLHISVYQASSPFQTLVHHLQLFSKERQEAAELIYDNLLERKDQRLKTFIVASFLGLILLGGILAVFILHLVKRIVQLRDGALQLAAKPESHALYTSGEDELAQLTRAFNQMQKKVQEREEALHDSKERLEIRVAERTHELRESNAELEQFAYVASHDLRQPLRMINSYLQLLEKRLGKDLDDENRVMMDFAREGAGRLDQMLVSLLEYSRVGRKGQPMEAFCLAEAIEEALTFLGPQVKETHASIQLPDKNQWPVLQASPDEMTRLFQNLLGNALKYTQPGQAPEIDVQLQPQGNNWLICIADSGIGVEPDQQDRLFKVFQRLHTRADYEGTGVGLAICRKIVERHGGRIWVESEGLDKGSRFCFLLPKK
ncbi:ATP-binding protein [Marinospirillum sp.]|uniref:sensor histidine kinase n=1 Tax=Marinospirillum sp. TaxID=2183934 RepID=UPI00286FC74A|nr:ATP-binding protein [Marinospirillum sp.]MDR9467237.1 ATP-binding protein [Marinospirillum sp.]